MKTNLYKIKTITVEEFRKDRSLCPDLRGDVTGIRGDVTWLCGDVSGIRGDVSPELYGDVTGIRGDVTGIRGDIDSCDLTPKERAKGVDIQMLVINRKDGGK